MSERITLGGRAYQSVGVSTFAHDNWVRGQLYRAGLTQLTLEDDETSDEFAVRWMDVLLAADSALLVLGGLIIPEGMDPLKWTPKTARATADHLGAISDPAEKRRARTVLAGALYPFFAAGEISLRRSQRSSNQPSQPTASNAGTAAVTHTDPGARSSGQ